MQGSIVIYIDESFSSFFLHLLIATDSACGLPLKPVCPKDKILLFLTIKQPTEGFKPVNPFLCMAKFMAMLMKYLSNFFSIAILLSSCSENDFEKKQIINCEGNVTVFYPPNYNARSHTPSFSVINEPSQNFEAIASTSLKIEFSNLMNRQIAQVSMGDHVDLYGTGEVMGDLIRNGKSVKLWNTDNYAYGKDNGQRLYQSHPWVLGVREDGSSFGVIADNTWKMEISLGERITFSSEGPAFRVIVIEKETPQDVMKELGVILEQENGHDPKGYEEEAKVASFIASLFLTHRGYALISQDEVPYGEIMLEDLWPNVAEFEEVNQRIEEKKNIQSQESEKEETGSVQVAKRRAEKLRMKEEKERAEMEKLMAEQEVKEDLPSHEWLVE